MGHYEDHTAEIGYPAQYMKTSLSTHLIRLADIYLVYAEAIMGNDTITSDADAVEAYNAVRRRAIKTHTDVSEITFMDLYRERRLELAMEGDNWYDLVRLHYYNPEKAKYLINSQERGYYEGLKSYYKGEITKAEVTITSLKLNITNDDDFRIPFPDVDALMNPSLLDSTSYDFDFSTIEY